MDKECLEELGSMTHRLRMLDNDPHHATAGSVGDLNPVPAERSLWCQIHGDGSHGVSGGVTIQLRHQQVVVLHPQGELLHVDVVDGPVGGPQEQEGPRLVVGSDGGQLLYLRLY